jgi:hypothetical protein
MWHIIYGSFKKIKVMKIKTSIFATFLFFVSFSAFCQDSTGSSKAETKLHKFFHPENKNNVASADSAQSVSPNVASTTLADSSYKTVVNNTPSAPPVTETNASPAPATPVAPVQPTPANTIYRDTRLGSSSPLYNTYEKNNNGAGSVTTNPNKG